jgi:hypothetical protein
LARDDAELELLKTAARQRLVAGQGELDLGLDATAAGGACHCGGRGAAGYLLRMGCSMPCRVLTTSWALAWPSGGDELFRDLVLAWIIEPASKLDSLRVLEEPGMAAAWYGTVLRQLPAYAKEPRRSGPVRGVRGARPVRPGQPRAL